MLYYLISLVPDFEKTPLRLFNYFTFRAAAALVTATLLGILLGPLTVRLLKKAVAPPRLEGIVAEEFVDHSKDKTPSMGGLLVVASIILATLLWGDPAVGRPDEPPAPALPVHTRGVQRHRVH